MLKKFIYVFVTAIFLASCGSTGKTNSDDAVELNVAIARSAADIMKKFQQTLKSHFLTFQKTTILYSQNML